MNATELEKLSENEMSQTRGGGQWVWFKDQWIWIGKYDLGVIVKTCSDICFTIGQKNCQMFVAKLHNILHPHNRMRFYHAHSVLSFPDFAVDTFLPQRFLR